MFHHVGDQERCLIKKIVMRERMCRGGGKVHWGGKVEGTCCRTQVKMEEFCKKDLGTGM